jgi:hypothetical protein
MMPELKQSSGGRVLVLGGQGVFGLALAEAFEAAGWAVIRTGRRPDPDPGFRHVDLAEPGTLERVLGDADVIVNTVPDEHLTAERMVLDRGGLLINVSAMAARAVPLLRDHQGEARGTVLMNAGIAPGLTNLVVADLLDRYPEADEVELVFTVSVKGSSGPAGGGFGHRGLTAIRRHRTVVVPLPEPYGQRRCLGFAEPDRGWLGETLAGGKTVRPYVCLRERRVQRALLALNAAGLIQRLPGAAFAAKPSGAGLTTEPVTHWVAVRRSGARLAARTIRCRGDMRAGAACTVLFAGALAARAKPGVLVPEEIFTLADVADADAAAGLAKAGLAAAGIAVVDETAGL